MIYLTFICGFMLGATFVAWKNNQYVQDMEKYVDEKEFEVTRLHMRVNKALGKTKDNDKRLREYVK